MNKEILSALHISCLQGNLNDVKKNIVKDWINPNIKSKPNLITPLHIASWQGSEIIIKYLVEVTQADIKAITKDGNTCLHFACVSNSPNMRIIELLLAYGLVISVQNKAGITPLMFGIYHAPIEFLQSFLSHYYSRQLNGLINQTDRYGCSVLHHAAWSGRSKVVQLLLQHGIDTQLMDLHRRRAYDLSVSTEIRNILTNSSHPNTFIQIGKSHTLIDQTNNKIESSSKVTNHLIPIGRMEYISFHELLETNDDRDEALNERKTEDTSKVLLPHLNPITRHRSGDDSKHTNSVDSNTLLNPFSVNDWNISFSQPSSLSQNDNETWFQKDFMPSFPKNENMIYYYKQNPISNELLPTQPKSVTANASKYSIQYEVQPDVPTEYSTSILSKTTEKFLEKKKIQKLESTKVQRLKEKLFGVKTTGIELQTDSEDGLMRHQSDLLIQKISPMKSAKRIQVYIKPKPFSETKSSDLDLLESKEVSLLPHRSYQSTIEEVKETKRNFTGESIGNKNALLSTKSSTNIEKHLQRRQAQMRRAFELEIQSGLSFDDDE